MAPPVNRDVLISDGHGLTFNLSHKEGTHVLRWADNSLLDLKWEEIGEHYGRYRLHVPEAERAMARSPVSYTHLTLPTILRV